MSKFSGLVPTKIELSQEEADILQKATEIMVRICDQYCGIHCELCPMYKICKENSNTIVAYTPNEILENEKVSVIL